MALSCFHPLYSVTHAVLFAKSKSADTACECLVDPLPALDRCSCCNSCEFFMANKNIGLRNEIRTPSCRELALCDQRQQIDYRTIAAFMHRFQKSRRQATNDPAHESQPATKLMARNYASYV